METEKQADGGAVQEKEVAPQVSERDAAFQRMEKDVYKWRQTAREKEEQLNKLLEERKAAEVKQMEEKEQYKELYEKARQEADTFQTRVDEIQGAYLSDLKFQTLEKEAIQAGIRSEALSDLRLFDTNGVIVETTSQGNANILGAKEFVEQLKASRPYLFQDKKPPTVNGSLPSGQIAEEKVLSAKELIDLQRKDPERYQKEVMKRLKT